MAKVELKAPVVAEISEAIKDAQSVAVSYTHLDVYKRQVKNTAKPLN